MIYGKLRTKKIIIGSDHRGQEIQRLISSHLQRFEEFSLQTVSEQDAEVIDYPDVAQFVAREVSTGRCNYGILICGTGIGVCVVANKFPGVRAAPCHNEVAAELSRKHNDSNVLCLSGDMLGERSTLAIVEKWLSTSFGGGRHQDRLEKIKRIEDRLSNSSFATESKIPAQAVRAS